MLAPFGTGNPRPLFEARGVEVVDGPRRLKDRHLKMALKQNGRIFRAIAWRAVEREQFITDNRGSLDLAFSLEHNRYQGNEYLELSVSDVRTTAARAPRLKMVTWQKRARLVVLAIAVGVVAVVFFTTRRRETPPPPAPIERGDPAATIESQGAFLVQVKGERETVRIEAEKQFSYPDGSMRLINAKVTSERQGKTFFATADEARVGENQTNLDMKGNVVMTSNDGLEARAGSATYSQGEGIVRAPGPVTFKRGRMSGSGVDFSYDEARDLMGLSDQAKVQLAPEKPGGEVTDITSGSAVLARTDKFVSFERAVHIVRGSQVIDTESALGDLTENQEHLTSLELQGNSRIETPNARPGELKLMSGDVINLTYYENSDLLESAVVAGSSALLIAAEKDSAERVLHADNIEIGMAPDGTTLTSLNARDHVVFDLSAAKGSLRRK